MKKGCCLFPLVAALQAIAVPEVSDVSFTQDGRGRMTVTYSLSAPAVVTFDVLTNGVSIGGRNVYAYGADGALSVTGDVGRVVSTPTGRIVWDGAAAWPDKRVAVRAAVTAWPTNDTPPYMVVDISGDFAGPPADRIRYYASADAVPGGIRDNDAYKTNALVFKRIYARYRPWTSGSAADKYEVVLTNDYYLAVFETTQAHWLEIKGSSPALFVRDGAFRPLENVSYCAIRESARGTADETYWYPAAPCPDSFLGILRERVGQLVDFDLPSLAQWEYAAYAGHVHGYWGDGSPVTTSGNQGKPTARCSALDRLGRYAKNGGYVPDSADARKNVSTNGLDCGTAVVGTYRPNAFGIYDMHGNVCEWCLDWYAAYSDRSADRHGGVHTEKTSAGTRDAMGGDCHSTPEGCRQNHRSDAVNPVSASYSYSRGTYLGFRLACRNGLK